MIQSKKSKSILLEGEPIEKKEKQQKQPIKILQRYYRDYCRKQGHKPHPFHIAARADALLQIYQAETANKIFQELHYEPKLLKEFKSYPRKLPKIRLNRTTFALVKIENLGF